MAGPTVNVRSNPYFGTYSNRPVIVQAPDAMVFINEEHAIPICMECGAKAEIKSYITNISTSLSLEGSGGGTCSFDILVPRHSTVSFIRDGKNVLANMMEVEIYFKGAFTINGMPRYYRSFWGYISGITDDYSDGTHSISVSCKDMLSFWNVIKFNLHPAMIDAHVTGQRSDLTAWQSRFQRANPFQILAYLSLVTRLDTVSVHSFLTNSVQSEDAREAQRDSSDQLIKYWAKRLNKISKAIRIYGLSGDNIFDAALFYASDTKTQKAIGKSLSSMSIQRVIGVSLDTNENFNPFEMLGDMSLFESDTRGRLDIMVSVKDHIGWEFYLDTNGEIVFKPPFYNVDTRQNYPISWVRDIDVTNWNFSEEEPEATRVDVTGFWHSSFLFQAPPEVQVNGIYQDMNLARQYGVREENITCQWLSSGVACGFYAADRMAKHAANRFQGSVTIPGRPELKLGLPIYIESRDCFYYVTSISHSFSFGSSFTTTLGLRGRRAKYGSTEFIGRTSEDVELLVDANGINRDRDGRNIGIPNVVMRPATTTEQSELKGDVDVFLHGTTDTNGQPQLIEPRTGQFTDPTSDAGERQRQKDDERRGISWYMAGQYWVYDINPLIMNLTWSPSDKAQPGEPESVSDAAIPVSDGGGYELIGSFPYGRGLVINVNGELVSLTGAVDGTGNPIPATESTVASIVESAIKTRDFIPDDLVEASENVTSRSSIGGGILSTASVLKVDQTNDGLLFSEMAPDDHRVNTCTCLDNYTIDNLLLLQSVDLVFTDVFDTLTSVDQLLTDSYQVTQSDITDYEAIKKSTQTGSGSGVLGGGINAPFSPTISEADRSEATGSFSASTANTVANILLPSLPTVSIRTT